MYFAQKVALVALAVGCNLASAVPTDVENALSGRQAVCNADLCLRAVRNTQLPTSTAVGYCASLLTTTQKTVTATASTTNTVYEIANPATVTISTSITTTTLSVDCTSTTTIPDYYKRAVSTTATVPAYQASITSACSALPGKPAQSPAAARISSACACALEFIGPTTTTTTLTTTITNPPDSVVATSTSTATTCTFTTVVQVMGPRKQALCSDLASPYTTSNGKRFNLSCGFYFDGRFGTQAPGSFTLLGCMNYCATQDGCAAFDRTGTNCYTFTQRQLIILGNNGGTFGSDPNSDTGVVQ